MSGKQVKQRTWWNLIVCLITAGSLIAFIPNGIFSMTPDYTSNVVATYSNYSINIDKPLMPESHHQYNFINHLSDFGLLLVNISNPVNNTLDTLLYPEYTQSYITCMGLPNTTHNIPNIIRYKQNLHYHFNISSHTFQYMLSENQMGLGLGNILSKYLAAKAMAYWFNYTFEWKKCDNYGVDGKYASKNLFSSFLSKSITSPKGRQLTHSNYAYFLYAKRVQYDTDYVHPSSLLFVYYNRFYRDILSMEFNNSLKTYYEFNKLNEKIQLNRTFTSIDSDIVIHIRCGDIWTYLGRNRKYGFLTTNYIKYSVTNGTEAIFNINWIKDKITKDTTIWIISQITKKSTRGSDKSALNDCYYLVNYLVNNSFSKIFDPATVKIVYDSDINDDFYKMMNAPLLICSSSSFCLLAAIANKNGYVIIPRIGPWIDLNDITNIDQNYSDIYSYDKIAKHSRFLPSNHLIMDNQKTGWFVKSVSDFSNVSKNITILAQYLLNH